MNITEKGRAIDIFTHDADYRVFLMSLKAGGVTLNLTVASHVFLMDPWWNPEVENPAHDRIHRIGQSTRFVIKGTVEERILQLQQKKQLVFEGTVGDSPDAMSKLTEADLKFLI
uniref:Helicase C-terminal domain-containing protein n=1 Tax=Zea mays TaxID=4577 RepID=A0A804U804_MAIZE